MAPRIPLSAPPWAVLGYRRDGRPIRPLAGGAADGEAAVEEGDGPPDNEETAAPEPADDWAPPTREEYEQLLAAKKKADGEAAARRKYLRQHGIDPKTGEKLQPDEPEEPAAPAAKEGEQPPGLSAAELRRQVDRAAAEAELRGMRKTKALVTGLNSALAEAGWNGQRLNSLMKLIDLDDVDVDDDGEISGLSEQIDGIKAEWPEFFKRTRTSATVANGAAGSGHNGAAAVKVDAADKKPPQPEPKGWAAQLAAKTLRG